LVVTYKLKKSRLLLNKYFTGWLKLKKKTKKNVIEELNKKNTKYYYTKQYFIDVATMI
jgi:hypothetical protein